MDQEVAVPDSAATSAASGAGTRRRQWGSEKRTEPLSTVHPQPSRRKVALGRLGIVVTILGWMAYVVSTILRQLSENPSVGFRFQLEAILYLAVVTFLTFSALMYLLARQGALYRFRDHRRVPRGELDRHFASYDESITVLVPSYAEEPDVVRATLWSAAPQEFPNLRVALLLDDPPHPTDPIVLTRLEATRALAAEIESQLLEPSMRFNTALSEYRERMAANAPDDDELPRLSAEHEAAAVWLETAAEKEALEDHVDEFFVDLVLMGLARELRLTILALNGAQAQQTAPDPDRMVELYVRLARIFTASMNAFERKLYASLSHEPNKAINLNAYSSLMGGRWRREKAANGVALLPALEHHVDGYPYDSRLLSPLIFITALPYFLAMGCDLRDWEAILYHGDRRLNRDMRQGNDHRRRISVR